MANRLHIVTNDKQKNDGPIKNSHHNLRLQEYISELLIEPVKEIETSTLTTIEKLESISESKAISNDRIPQYRSKVFEQRIHTYNNDPKISLNTENSLAKENLENKPTQDIKFSELDPRLEKVSRLLEKIATIPLGQSETETESLLANDTNVEANEKRDIKTELKEEQEQNEQIQTTNESSFVQRESKSLRDSLDDSFQTLIFDVNNLPLAVPLVKLGGIVNITKQYITPLVGTPDWFLGLIPNERGNLMVVDTQKFIMPERPVKDDRTYDYLIVLDNSQWALACHSVGDAKNLHASDIRWSNKSSKRPWFAGMVVEYMSALIEVDALINQLADQIVD